jgi:hypothetical protein
MLVCCAELYPFLTCMYLSLFYIDYNFHGQCRANIWLVITLVEWYNIFFVQFGILSRFLLRVRSRIVGKTNFERFCLTYVTVWFIYLKCSAGWLCSLLQKPSRASNQIFRKPIDSSKSFDFHRCGNEGYTVGFFCYIFCSVELEYFPSWICSAELSINFLSFFYFFWVRLLKELQNVEQYTYCSRMLHSCPQTYLIASLSTNSDWTVRGLISW